MTGRASSRHAFAHPRIASAANTTARTASAVAHRCFQSDRATDAVAAPVAVVVKAGFPSASANAFADSKRSAASFSRDLAVAAAMWGGTDFRTFVTGSAGSVTIFMMIACADPPVCGGSPVSISYSTLPRE